MDQTKQPNPVLDLCGICSLVGNAIARAPEAERVAIAAAIERYVATHRNRALGLLNDRGFAGDIWNAILEAADCSETYGEID
jgi:hypothetical protein